MAKYQLIKNAELVEVSYEKDNKKAVLTFLDKENREIRLVNFNKQVYRDGKYTDSKEKAKVVDEWCKEYFNTTFEKLSSCIGVKKDIYAYPTFSSLFEVDIIEKFQKEQNGKIYQTEIKEVIKEELFIRLRYDIEGLTYESKASLGTFVPKFKQYFNDPVKREKALKKFKEKFGVPVEEAETLVGRKIIVEVKSAFSGVLYGDIKKIPQ